MLKQQVTFLQLHLLIRTRIKVKMSDYMYRNLTGSPAVADPGFPVGGGADLVGGCQLTRQLRFEKFVCQNERIWTRRGPRAGGAPPWIRHCPVSCRLLNTDSTEPVRTLDFPAFSSAMTVCGNNPMYGMEEASQSILVVQIEQK